MIEFLIDMNALKVKQKYALQTKICEAVCIGF